jgi:hypothetical protein
VLDADPRRIKRVRIHRQGSNGERKGVVAPDPTIEDGMPPTPPKG